MNITKTGATDFVGRAVFSTYFQVVQDVNDVPFLEEIMDTLPKNMMQELFMDIVINDRMQTYDVTSEKELEQKIISGKLDHLMPTPFVVEEILNLENLAYFNLNQSSYHQVALLEVW